MPGGESPMASLAYRDAEMVELPGGRLAAVRRGSGPPALFLHGIPLSLLTWRANLDYLARRNTVVAVDMRGFGRSDKPPDADYSVTGQAAVIETLITRLRLSPVTLVGSSYGCAVAITLADMAPELVTKLVLINPVCYPGGAHSLTRLARTGLLATLARTSLRTSLPGRKAIGLGLKRSYASFTQATPELVAAYHQLLVRAGGERAYLATLRQLDETSVARRVPALIQQTLLIWGEQDRVLPAANAGRMAAELSSCRLEILRGTGHFPHEEAPDRVNRLIASFLAEHGHRAAVHEVHRRDDNDADVRMDGLGRARTRALRLGRQGDDVRSHRPDEGRHRRAR
jgi:pimeloyl-ACP methyl ester carboxylesterase